MNWQASLLFAFLVCAALTTTSGDESSAIIEAKLIYATNSEDAPKGEATKDIESRLKPDFGYKYYSLLGEKSVKLQEGDEEKEEPTQRGVDDERDAIRGAELA